MGLEIRQTYAKIGIETIPGKLDIETRQAKLNFKQKHAKINLHTELPKVKIDQYECFASAGRKGPIDLTREIARLARQQVMEYIGKTAEDGSTLAAIERGGTPIADIAVRDAYPVHQFGIDFIPKARPKITVTGGVKVDPERNSEGISNGVEGEYIPPDLKIDFTPTVVNIYLRQKASISFQYTGNKVDISI
jgi:hypothetical protein